VTSHHCEGAMVAAIDAVGIGDCDDHRWSSGIDVLGIGPRHCETLLGLPGIHKDPFDRMLIAQARTDGLLLITRDSQIIAYGKAGATTANLM